MGKRAWEIFTGTHNDKPPAPVATGFTRGIVAAALAEVVFLIVRFLPLDPSEQVEIVGHTTALVVLVSYVVYALLDRLLKGAGKDGDGD